MPLLRPLLAVAAGASLLAAPAPVSAAGGGSADLREQARALAARVEEVGAELERGAADVEAAEARLGALTSRQVDVARALDGATTATSRAQADVDALARAAWKGAVLPPTLSAVLTGDPRALADLARVRTAVDRTSAARAAEVRALAAERERTRSALGDAERLRREALVLREQLERDTAALADRAGLLSAELAATSAALDAALQREAEQARAEAAAAATAAAARRAAAREAAARAALVTVTATTTASPSASDGCAPVTDGGWANGFLPAAVLCPSADGALLRTDAARALTALAAAYEAGLGDPLCVTDSYRDYAGQVDVFRRKPALAAVPGRSQHGWGLAVDLCGGVQSFGTREHLWMREHAPSFGWVHPRWARADGSRPEAWHWEFGDRS